MSLFSFHLAPQHNKHTAGSYCRWYKAAPLTKLHHQLHAMDEGSTLAKIITLHSSSFLLEFSNYLIKDEYIFQILYTDFLNIDETQDAKFTKMLPICLIHLNVNLRINFWIFIRMPVDIPISVSSLWELFSVPVQCWAHSHYSIVRYLSYYSANRISAGRYRGTWMCMGNIRRYLYGGFLWCIC